MTRTLVVATNRQELATALPPVGGTGDVGLVMTMGALHAGHAALIRAARQQNDTVVVTVFVNPTQFGPSEDFGRYPRNLDADLAVCADEGVDVVFAPATAEVYRGRGEVTIHPGPLGDQLEGAVRPGHFAGVLTVVHKLLHILGHVDRAYFGEKDYQQFVLVQRMAADLDLPTQIVGRPTVREADGLALSSRNRYLSVDARAAATALPRALAAAVAAAESGADGAAATAVAASVLRESPELSADYLELRSADLGPAPERGPARLLSAVRLGPTRLIDNVAVTLRGTP
ncbi:MAG: pantoate--beta-alanine ligase [Mycobacteriales bacterium]